MLAETVVQASQVSIRSSLKAFLHTTMQAVAASRGAVALANGDLIATGPFPNGKEMTVVHQVMTEGKALVLRSPEQTSQFPDLIVDQEELLPLISVPIHSQGKAVGALQVHIPFLVDDEDICQKLDTLQIAAELMGCLLKNAGLQRELQRKEMYVMRLVKATLDGQEAERERVCLEVHDGITQTLASAFQYLQALETTLPSQETEARHLLNRTEALVRQAIQEARWIINSITPATLSDLGLMPTLRQELKQFEKDTGCKVELESNWLRLAPQTEIALFRIIHEAITNVRKHAKSPKMRIELSRLPGRLVALIRDWGVGFDNGKQEPVPTKNGFGLFSMRKRAELLGGTCEVRSALGQGTEVRVEVPIAE